MVQDAPLPSNFEQTITLKPSIRRTTKCGNFVPRTEKTNRVLAENTRTAKK